MSVIEPLLSRGSTQAKVLGHVHDGQDFEANAGTNARNTDS